MKFQEIYERCWTGYRQAGMKKKGDRMVPNCVPVEENQASPERNTAKSLAQDLKGWIEDFNEIKAAGLDSTNINYIRKLKRNIETAHEQIRRLGYRFDANNPDLVRLMGRPLGEVKIGPEMSMNELLYTAAARAIRDAGREGIDLDYEDAIKQAAQIYGVPYTPSQLPKLRAQLKALDDRIAPLKQQLDLKKQQRKQQKYGVAPATTQPQVSVTPTTGRIKPPAKTLEETEADLAEDLKKWFKEKWVRFGPDGKIRGACARGSESEGKPKCLPQSKAHALGKKGRASAAAKKRREDPNPERRGAAKNVATKVNELSPATLQSYADKRGAQVAAMKADNPDAMPGSAEWNKIAVPAQQVGRAKQKIARQQQQKQVKEQYTDDDDWYDDQDDRLRDGDYVRDRQDGEHGEIFRMSGDPSERRVRILDRDGRGWYISPERLVAVDRTDPDIMKYFGKRRQRDMDEQLDASGGRMYQAKEKFLLRHNGKDIAFFNTAEEAKQAAQEMMRELKGFASVHRVMREDQAKTMYRVIFNGRPIDMLFSTLQQAQMIAKRLEQEHGGKARIDHTVDVPKDLVEKQDACYRKVKSRYKVWPSAYASGALVQCRKKGAANWGTGAKKK